MNNTYETSATRPLPRKCVECRERRVELDRLPYSTEIVHDGLAYTVAIPDLEILRCRHCGAIVLTDEANRRISAAFRQQAQLLSPEEIRSSREALGLTQKELAAHLGVAESTLA